MSECLCLGRGMWCGGSDDLGRVGGRTRGGWWAVGVNCACLGVGRGGSAGRG